MSSPTTTTLPLSPQPTQPTSATTPDTPRRKPRPSPIHVPASPNTQGAGPREPPATATGVVWRRKPSFALPLSTPRSAGLDDDLNKTHTQSGAVGVIGENRSRRSSAKDWLPAPKSAAANFAQTRGIQSVTVRTMVSPSPPTSARTPLSSSSLGTSEGELRSPAIIMTAPVVEKEKQKDKDKMGLKSAGSGLRSSRTVEVDFLRNEMERAIRANGVDLGKAEGENGEIVRNDIVLCKFYHTPGLTCTSRPCRFVHEFSPSATPSSATFPTDPEHDASQSGDGLTNPVEIVEIYPMSGGGKGAGSKYSKAKYRTVACRDWEEKGECGYGEFCSFVHRDKVEKDAKPEVEEKEDGKSIDVPKEKSTGDEEEQREKEKGLERPSSTRPKSFNGGPIVVPDLRWTRDDGLTVSKPATGTKPDFRHVANKLVETISSATPGSATLEVVVPQPKSSTPATAAQYASVPPRSAWVVGPPRMLGFESAKQGVSPDLPISAYTFSTDSPGTPYHGIDAEGDSDVPEEAVEPAKQNDQARVQIVGSAEHTNGGNSPYDNPHMVLPSYLQPIHDSGAYPWPIERLYPQAMQATWEAILKNPKEQQQDLDVEEATRRLVAMKLARMVKGGDLPPQEVQSKMNYRTKPCKFYADGECPRGDSCSYLHDPSNKGIPAPKPLSDKVVKRLPCKFFNTSEGCKAGDGCPFLHVRVVPFVAPLMLRPRPWRTRPCRHFQTGTCVAGEQCHFAHYLEDKPVKEQKKCAFFSTDAGCKLGDECKFAHIPEVIVEHEVAVLA